jgi:polysaccharide export outer membrane protein
MVFFPQSGNMEKSKIERFGNFLDCTCALAGRVWIGFAFAHAARVRQACLLALFAAFAVPSGAQDKQSEYRLGAGDTVRITVYQNPDLTLETKVSENGAISYPLIGQIRIGGMTAVAAEQAVARALRSGGFIQNPQVNVIVQQARGNQVSILGQVNKPGRYALETVNVRLSEILATAGGIAKDGADSVIVTGVREGKPFRREIDFPAIFVDQRMQDDIVVESGDVMYVHRAPVYYIYGEVQKPGSYRIERGMTVRQALVQAGGPSTRGTERGLRLHRRAAGGSVETRSPDLNDSVQSDDIYFVRESLF